MTKEVKSGGSKELVKAVSVFSEMSSDVEALMYACPPESKQLLDATREWSFPDFRQRHLEAFVREVIRPCRSQFESTDVGTPRK